MRSDTFIFDKVTLNYPYYNAKIQKQISPIPSYHTGYFSNIVLVQ